MSRYRVRHNTTYVYEGSVVSSHNEACLKPRAVEGQRLEQSVLEIDPQPDKLTWRRDYFGNEMLFFDIEQPHDRLEVEVRSEVEVTRGARPEGKPSAPWEEIAKDVRTERTETALDAFQFVFDSILVKADGGLAGYAQPSFAPGRPIVEAVLDLNHRIYQEFEYDPKATTVATPVEEVLVNRRGVCQDFAHLMIGCVRSLGLPARYVSGYVGPRPSAVGAPAKGGDLVGAHASHAWLAVFCGDQGWIEFDPTNDLVVGDQHVVLGWGRDYDDVSPIKGVTLGGGRQEVSVEVVVQPIE